MVDDLVKYVSDLFAGVFSSDRKKKRCAQCNRSLLKDKKDVCFCSELCALEGYKKKAKEKGICSYPSCKERCFVEQSSHRQYDFCGQSHATEYNKLKTDIVSQNPTCSKRRRREEYIVLCSNQMDVEEAHKREAASSKHTNGEIQFYSKYKDYYEFTNFAEFPITVDGKKWHTSEHYFQAQKFIGTPYMEVIRELQSPREAFEFSREPHVRYWRRGDWEEIKIDVMLKALLAKFTQYEHLRTLLIKTGDRILIEHTSNDTFWGDGGEDKNGNNMLGVLLMAIRESLKSDHTNGNDNKCSDSRSDDKSDCQVETDSSSKDEEMDTLSELVTIQHDNKNLPSCRDNNNTFLPVESCNLSSHQHIVSSTENCGVSFGKVQEDVKVQSTSSETVVTLGSEPIKTQEQTQSIGDEASAEGGTCNPPSKEDKEKDEPMDSGENTQTVL